MDADVKLKILLGVVLILLVGIYLSLGKTFFDSLSTTTIPQTTTVPTTTSTMAQITTFTDNGGAVETKNGKPVIRMFSTTWCPHCRWVKDAYETVAKEYVDRGEIIAYHWEFDIDDDTLRAEKIPVPDSEKKIFRRFNPGGGVPTFIFGSKYYRIGNGHEREKDLEAEKAEFRAVIEAVINESKQIAPDS